MNSWRDLSVSCSSTGEQTHSFTHSRHETHDEVDFVHTMYANVFVWFAEHCGWITVTETQKGWVICRQYEDTYGRALPESIERLWRVVRNILSSVSHTLRTNISLCLVFCIKEFLVVEPVNKVMSPWLPLKRKSVHRAGKVTNAIIKRR